MITYRNRQERYNTNNLQINPNYIYITNQSTRSKNSLVFRINEIYFNIY